MPNLEEEIEAEARRTGFSGVVRAERGGDILVERAYGFADRARRIPNTTDTIFALASGAKPLTALSVMGLVQDGTLGLDTTARSILGNDLPLIADDVTVELLLAHRSGIGDYLDEHSVEVTDYVMPVPVHRLATTEDYLAVLDGHPTVFPAGERFAYNNGGYVVLALIAERASGVAYHDLVASRVTAPAGMVDTAFLRSDEPVGREALNYLEQEGHRTNLLHMPVRGNGDGGVSSTAADLSRFWDALFSWRILPELTVETMLRPRSDWPEEERRYALGFHVHATRDEVVWIEGHDAGVSFLSTHDRSSAITHTVIANTSEGAWPLVIAFDRILGTT